MIFRNICLPQKRTAIVEKCIRQFFITEIRPSVISAGPTDASDRPPIFSAGPFVGQLLVSDWPPLAAYGPPLDSNGAPIISAGSLVDQPLVSKGLSIPGTDTDYGCCRVRAPRSTRKCNGAFYGVPRVPPSQPV